MIKNIWLGSLILLISSSWSFAQTIPDKNFSKPNSPVFLVNGFVDFSAASHQQNSDFEGKNLPDGTKNFQRNSLALGNDSQFFFKSAIMTESRAKYGAIAKVEFNVNSNRQNENLNLDQAFLFSEGEFGKFEIGNNQAANQKMKSGPARFARGAGGINGKYLEQVNLPMLGNSGSLCSGGAASASCSNIKLPRFILLAQSPIGHGGNAKSFYRFSGQNFQSAAGYGDYARSNFRALKDDSFDGMEDATKISYYTPRFEGLQLGASYTPSSGNNGISSTTARDLDAIRIDNIVSLAANYSQNFDNLGVVLSATSEHGQVKNSKSLAGFEREDLSAYDLAANFSYFGFNLGASYGSWKKSLQTKNGIYSCDYDSSQNLAAQTCQNGGKKFSNPHYYTAGIGYEFGPIAASITGIRSEFQKNSYRAISFGVDYKLTKSLMPYAEFTKFSFISNQPKAFDLTNQNALPSNQRQLKNNSGYVAMTGILWSF